MCRGKALIGRFPQRWCMVAPYSDWSLLGEALRVDKFFSELHRQKLFEVIEEMREER